MPHQLDLLTPPAQAWTDGALKRGECGGWGAIVLLPDGEELVLRGQEKRTTSNRMEMMGALSAILAVPEGAAIHVLSDSQYVVYGITKWWDRWRQRGWRRPTGETIPNKDLWVALHEAVTARRVSLEWVRGHAGHPMNERADVLASNAAHDLVAGRQLRA